MKILVADDDAMMQMLLERQLAAWGHEVYLVSNGAEAFAAIEKDLALEVLLIDWMMPGLDGLEVCRRTRCLDRSHYTFIILMTSRTGKDNFLAGMSAGADDFMTKPLDVDELRVRIHSAERVIHLQTEAQVQAAIAAELRELDQMKSSFISLTSHELRSPIALILMNLELLTKYPSHGKQEASKCIAGLSSAAQRLWRIVEEILKASREGNYEKELCLEQTDLGALIHETINGVTPFAALRSQHITASIADDLPIISVDPGKMTDILANLLMNAIKFSADNMTINIAARRMDSDTLLVSVSDSGAGISEADKPHIFERFFSTLDITHHSSGQYEFGKRGIGLGLAIVKDFVEMHGGNVGFESEEGHGSCFHFTIPVKQCL